MLGSPYKFEAPWHAFEFAFHVLEVESNLVIVSMAWMTRQDRRLFTRQPNEPDMDTFTYWVTRLEPLIRSETQHEVIVVSCNRTGIEDDVTYAGTSAVIGIQDGEVKVYGLLGRGEKELLVVDTDKSPYAKLIYQPQPTPPVPAGQMGEAPPDGAHAGDNVMGPQAKPESHGRRGGQHPGTQAGAPGVSDHSPSTSRSAGPPAPQPASAFGLARAPLPVGARLKHAPSPHTTTSPSSSVPFDGKKDKAKRRQIPAITVPAGLTTTPGGHAHPEETDATNIPTPSAPSPTPIAIRPRLAIPDSDYDRPRAWLADDPTSAASQMSERSVQSVKSDQSEASTISVRSNLRPPEDSTPYPHSGAPVSAHWSDRTPYGGYMRNGLGCNDVGYMTASHGSSSESPRWFWRPPESSLQKPVQGGLETGTPIRMPEPFPWDAISSPTTGRLDMACETKHAGERVATLSQGRAKHLPSSDLRASSEKAGRSGRVVEESKMISRERDEAGDVEVLAMQNGNRPPREEGSKSTVSQHTTSAGTPRRGVEAYQRTQSAHETEKMSWDRRIPHRPSSPKSRNCSRSRPSDATDFYRDVQTIPIAASPSILDDVRLPSRMTPRLDHGPRYRSASRKGHQRRGNSMTSEAVRPQAPRERGGMMSADRDPSRGRQPGLHGPKGRPGGPAGATERASSADSTRNAILHSRFHKRRSTTEDGFTGRRSSYRPVPPSRPRLSARPDGNKFERFEAIVCPDCPVHGRQAGASSAGEKPGGGVETLPASVEGERPSATRPRSD